MIPYAYIVRYEIEGFLEKNRDTVSDEQLSILKASQVGTLCIVQSFFILIIILTSLGFPGSQMCEHFRRYFGRTL